MNYKTKQKQAILDYFDKFRDEHHSINDICLHFKNESNPIGTTTVYRYIDTLLKDGVIKKIVIDNDSTTYYQYVNCNQNHIHLKCEKCGKLIHLDCQEFQLLEAHILIDHNFKIDMRKTIVYGTCNEC